METNCKHCGEESDTVTVCGDHEYCAGCVEVKCDWCVGRGLEPSVCPVCKEVWCLDLGPFVCADCVRGAHEEGAIKYCADHGRCFLKTDPCESLPGGADAHAGCATLSSRVVVYDKLCEVWRTL